MNKENLKNYLRNHKVLLNRFSGALGIIVGSGMFYFTTQLPEETSMILPFYTYPLSVALVTDSLGDLFSGQHHSVIYHLPKKNFNKFNKTRNLEDKI